MTASFPYSTDHDPPCPVLPLRVAAPHDATGIALVGVVDTGADMTLIPERLARALDLPVVARLRVVGVTGDAETADVMAVAIELSGRSFLAEVAAFGGEAILGRDLLNRLALRLDGPRRTLKIGAVGGSRRQTRRPRSRQGKG